MRTQCSPDLFGFAPVEGRLVEAAFDAGLATSDAGALLLSATDKAVGLIERFADCFDDVCCSAWNVGSDSLLMKFGSRLALVS